MLFNTVTTDFGSNDPFANTLAASSDCSQLLAIVKTTWQAAIKVGLLFAEAS